MKKLTVILGLVLVICLLASFSCAPLAPLDKKVMVGETKILERQMTEWGKPTGKFEKWKITLNWYTWEDDKVTVNVKATNIGQEKALMAPELNAVDSQGDYGDKMWGVRDEYRTALNVWPGKEVVGSKAFQFGPLSKGVKLYVYLLVEPGQRVEFTLGR